MKELEQIEIGRYQIQSHLARGGMADVYLARDSEKDQIVAIKMVHDSAGEYCERFQREVKVMAGLVHEHILPAFDYGEYESWYFLVTPYIEYGTLNGRLAAGPLTLEEVDPILVQLAEALQFAHEQGIVHRDVKPSNVLMRDGNHVYLADFGLVKRVGQENGLTVTGYLIGTPEYMAPELAEEDATPQSDVYALGVLLYQMLAGRVPFKANTPMGVFLRHIRDDPEMPTTFNAAIPIEVEEVILRAMEKDPQKRYQSTRELYQAYQQAVKNAAIRATALADQPTQIPGPDNQLARAGVVDVRVVRQRGKVRRSVLVAALATVFILAGIFAVASSVFSPGGQGNNIHAADAADARNRHASTPAARRVTPGSSVDSAATNRPATGSTNINAAAPTSTTDLNQSPGSSTLQQNVNPASGSSQGVDSGGVTGQGTTSDTGNGNGGSGGGQSTGSSGSGQDTSGSGGGQSTGSSGSGGGQSTGSSGSGGGTSGSGGGQSTGSSGSGGGTSGSGGGQSTGSSGSGNGQGDGNGKGKGNGNGQGNGNGKGKGNGDGNGQGNGNGSGNGKGKGKGNGGGD